MTIADLTDGWKRAREVLLNQLTLLDRDPVFPDANLSADRRRRIADRIKAAVAEYDALLAEYASTPLARAIAEMKADARAAGLSDVDIDAELAAYNAERRVRCDSE